MSDLFPYDKSPIPIVPDLSDEIERTNEVVGRGGCGTVYKGRWLGAATNTTPVTIAIKIIDLVPLRDDAKRKRRFKQITRELSLWCSIQHENILPLLGIVRINGDTNVPAFVCPWMENGNAKEFCSCNPQFPPLFILYDIINGLHYLHTFKPEIVHGDIKAASFIKQTLIVNVLINNQCEACLCDFGLSRFLIDNTLWKTTATHAGGTARWMAPELMNGDVPTPTKESDIYAYAMTCYEILSGDVPFKSVSNDVAILFKVMKGQRPNRIESFHSDFMWNIITRCWEQEPKDRLPTEKILELLWKRKEEEEKERLRKEDEAKELRRKEEEKRRREQEEQNRLAEEKAREEEERRKAEEDRALKQKQEEEAKAQTPRASQGGVEPMSSHRTCNKRGEKKSKASKAAAAAVGPQTPKLEPVAPLSVTENRWDWTSFSNNEPDSPEVVDTNVKAHLDKLPMEDFDSISDQIIQWANRSEKWKDGRILIQVTRLVFEKAIDDAPSSGIYARLCKKMVEQISPKVQDEGIKNSQGKPITGGQLFCKYLLSRCHEDFERGWSAIEVTAPNEGSESDESYAAQKARRQGLGLIKFIGELFKRQMLTEHTMHERIKKLFVNAENLLEQSIEGLCTLLTTIGSLLDTRKARAHMNIYFQRIQELSKNVSPRMQSMLQDVIELRKRNWKAVVAPTIISQVYQAAAKEKADEENEVTQQRLSMSRGGSSRGGTRDDYPPQADGWNSVSSRATARAGDLSQFGRFSKAQPPTTLGPSSVFVGNKDLKREAISRMNSSSNMFSALQEAQQEFNKAAEPLQRRKLVLQPRSKPVEEPNPLPEESIITPSSEEASPVSTLTGEAADAKISEDIKEFKDGVTVPRNNVEVVIRGMF